MIRRGDEVIIRNGEPRLVHRPQEGGQADVADRVLRAVDERDFLVPHRENVPGERLDALPVFGLDARPVVENVVDGDQRKRAGDELEHFTVVEVGTDDANAVHIAIAAMLEVGHLGVPHVVGDEGDIVAPALGLLLEGLQHGGEIAVGEAALGVVRIEHAEVERAPDLEAPRDGVGAVAHFVGHSANLLAGFLADVRIIVQGFTDGRDGQAAPSGQLFDCYGHVSILLFVEFGGFEMF